MAGNTMMMYLFHYNGDLVDEIEEVEEGELTYHEHLLDEDGKPCRADISEAWKGCNGEQLVEAFFDDGNELTVYVDELEELKE